MIENVLVGQPQTQDDSKRILSYWSAMLLSETSDTACFAIAEITLEVTEGHSYMTFVFHVNCIFVFYSVFEKLPPV